MTAEERAGVRRVISGYASKTATYDPWSGDTFTSTLLPGLKDWAPNAREDRGHSAINSWRERSRSQVTTSTALMMEMHTESNLSRCLFSYSGFWKHNEDCWNLSNSDMLVMRTNWCKKGIEDYYYYYHYTGSHNG